MRVLIFFLSLAMAGGMLALERAMGIGWDYHPDSVTYATTSIAVTNEILSRGYLLAANNLYFLWVALLDMDITAVTTANMLFFAFTNVLLYGWHSRYAGPFVNGRLMSAIAISLLIANPYRLHLSTTMLKDSMIIMLTTYVALRPWKKAAFAVPFLVFLRIAGAVYLSVKLNPQQLRWLLVGSLLLAAAFSDPISTLLMDRNSTDMQLRNFDQIPNFQDFGMLGVLLRSLTWPILGISGLFVFVSPTSEYIPLAVASIMSISYCVMVPRRAPITLSILVPMIIIAAVVTGFTAFIRYVYPLLVVLPVVVTRAAYDDLQEKKAKLVEALKRQAVTP